MPSIPDFSRLFRLSCRRSACLGAFIALAMGTASFAQPPAPPAPPRPPIRVQGVIVGAPFDYTDSVREDGTLLGLQTAIRRFDPKDGTGPIIYLVAAVHIGDKAYYKKLQAFLNQQDVVLCEGIRPSAAKPSTPGKNRPKAKPAPERDGNEFYVRLAKILNLATQGEIDYRQPNFYSSDLSWDDLERLAKQNGAITSRKIREMKAQHALSGPEATALAQDLKRLASDPVLAKSFRNHLVERLLYKDARAPEEKSKVELKEEKEEAEFDAIVITARNQRVISDLKRLLTRPTKKPLRSIALFYGAGHMVDLDARLESDLGYRGRGADWLTAITTVP